MNTRIPRATVVAGLGLALGLAVAGCKQQSSGQNEAPAEVLSGTISDAMPPYDTVTSQPPLDPRVQRAVRAGAAEVDDAATDGATEAVPAPVGPAE